MSERCNTIVSSARFQAWVTVVVAIAAVEVGLESYPGFRASHGLALAALDLVVTVAFTAEITLRFIASRDHPVRFFTQPLNLLDTLLVVGAWVPLTAGLVSVVRLVRLLRVLRLVRTMPKLRLLIATTLNSVPSILSIMVLLGLLFYVYAVAGVFLFSANDPIHFRDLPTSTVSLFRVITLEDWTDIMYTQIYGCDDYGYTDTAELCRSPQAFGPFGALFFMSFVFVGTWVVLNLFIGIILGGMDEARREVDASPVPASRTIDLLRMLRRRHLHLTGSGLDGSGAASPERSWLASPNGVDGRAVPPPAHAAPTLEAQLSALENQVRAVREQVARDRRDGGAPTRGPNPVSGSAAAGAGAGATSHPGHCDVTNGNGAEHLGRAGTRGGT